MWSLSCAEQGSKTGYDDKNLTLQCILNDVEIPSKVLVMLCGGWCVVILWISCTVRSYKIMFNLIIWAVKHNPSLALHFLWMNFCCKISYLTEAVILSSECKAIGSGCPLTVCNGLVLYKTEHTPIQVPCSLIFRVLLPSLMALQDVPRRKFMSLSASSLSSTALFQGKYFL